LAAPDKFNSEHPIDVYWLEYAVTPTPKRSDLIWIEKKMAYGYDAEKIAADKEFKIALKALTGKNSRYGRLCFDRNKQPVVLFNIGGSEAQLLKIFVNSQETLGLIPTVLYVELFGRDPITFEEKYEKFTPGKEDIPTIVESQPKN